MRVIDLDVETPNRRLTVMSYGASRAGKTRFAATFPRPLFLSDGSEGGWETVRNMNPDDMFEPGRKPQVWAMDKTSDFVQALQDCQPLIKRGEVQTLAIDSLTFYAESYIAWLQQANPKIDNRQLYQQLSAHIRAIMIRVHQLPANIVWLALERAPDEDNAQGGIMIPGGSRQTVPARCDYWLYHRTYTPSPAVGSLYEIRTRPWGGFKAGGRDEGRVPDPLPECNYRALADALGIVVEVGKTMSIVDSDAPEAMPVANATPPPQRPVAPARPAPPPAPAPARRFVPPPRPPGR